MKRAWIVAKKDMQIYYSTPLAYIVMALTIFMMSFFFDRIVDHYLRYAQNAGFGQSPQSITLNFAMESFYRNMMVIFMFMMPGLTMRSFCSEKRENTLELLVTSPIHLSELVIGKFLGVGTIYAGILLSTLVYALCAIAFGTNIDIPVLLSIHLGLFLIGMSFVAIGVFTSSLTSNQFIAYISALTLILCLFLLGSSVQNAPGIWGDIIEKVNVIARYQDFTKGVMSTGNFVFFFSFFFFWLFLTYRVIESQSWRN